jgi:hypothetical protein
MSDLLPDTSNAPMLERLADQVRRESTEALSPKALRWLALLPEWTEALAASCGFPVAPENIETTIERAQAAMLCEVLRQRDFSGEDIVRFWMPTSMRTWLFDRWEQLADVHLEDDVAEIAKRLLETRSRGADVSLGILRWAQLAQVELSAPVVTGDYLSDCVRQSLDAGDIAAAGEWLFAGEWLSRPLGAAMEMAVSRAKRQISLHHLRSQDADYLSRFLMREDQLEELRKVAGSEKEWGVHFIGLSGVGKTMLMRFVTSRHEDNPFSRASRVDFDYIDPRIPLERPATLLQELAEGFAADLDRTQEGLFKSFLEAVRTAESAGAAMVAQSSGWAAGAPEFDDAVKALALFLQELTQPVALVLDTCEELAKLHPPGGRMWGVEATFEILEQVRREAPDLKLVVAGRRWLTSRYANEEREDPAPREVMLAPAREFLCFHEMRGFSKDEVRLYLRDVRRLGLDEELLKMILANTIDTAGIPGVRSEDESRGEPERYSPNDLAFVADTLQKDPELGRKALAEGNFDFYVKERILNRLKAPAVLDAIPAVTVLGYFDAATIEPILGKTPVGRRQVLNALIAEDWTHLEGGPEAEDVVIKVDDGLLPRLEAFYDRTFGRRRLLDETRRKLRQHLAAKLEEAPAGVTVEVVDAAARLLPPEEMVTKLERAAERVVAEGAWGWAEAVGQRLLYQERNPPLDESLQAIVWSLYLTGVKHSRVRMDLAPLWKGVAKLADAHPEMGQRQLLRARSLLAALAAEIAERDVEVDAAAVLLHEGQRLLRKRGGSPIASALLAACEGLIDVKEERGAAIPVETIDGSLERLSQEYKGQIGLQAHLVALRGRLHALHDDPVRASTAFSLVALMPTDIEDKELRFADWEAPASPANRAMLELLRFRLAREEEGEGLLNRCEELVYGTPGNADAAQLLSLVLQARLAKGELSDHQIESATSYEGTVESYALTALAHHTTPPLFVSVAQGWMACGKTERGLRLLRERERLATSRRTEEGSTGAAALALLVALRRLRLREGLTLASHLAGSDQRHRTEALAAGSLIAGMQPTLDRNNEEDHAAWRARNLLEARSQQTLPPSDFADKDLPAEWVPRVHKLLDLLEAELVRQRWQRQSHETARAGEIREQLTARAVGEAPGPSLRDPLGQERLRLLIRCKALLDDFDLHLSEDDRLVQIGEIALEEGELLALRVPDRATELLALAASCFDRAKDYYGAFIAELRQAIAEIHAGRHREAARRHENVVARYERLCEERESLPALGMLIGIHTSELRRLIHANEPWRGWLWRFVFYLDWYEGQEEGAEAEATAMEFGPEFSLASASGARHASRSLRRGARRESRADRSPTFYRWLPLALALLGLLLPGLGTTLLVTGASAVAVILVAMGLTVALVLAVGLVEGVGPRLRRRVLPLAGFDVALTSGRRRQGPAVQTHAQVTVQPRARLWPLRLYLRTLSGWRKPTFSIIPIGGSPPGGNRLPYEIRQALRRPLFGGYLPLRLEVGFNLASVAWEQILLSELIEDPRWTPRRSPQAWRVRPHGFPLPQPVWGADICAVSSPAWRLFLENSSAREVKWLQDVSALGALPDRRTLPPGNAYSEGSYKGVIALGSPVITRAGWRLRLDEEELSQALLDPSQPRRQQLVKPERLARKFPVVVLVGRPGGRLPATDKQVSDGLRGLANEIFLAGAHAVVTIPVLPPRVAATAIDFLVEELGGWMVAPDEEQLRRTVEQLHSDIYAMTELSGEERERLRRAELALDVCLFAPHLREDD